MSTISRRVLHLEGRQQCWWEEDWAGACCSGVQPRQSTARSQACQRAKPSACRPTRPAKPSACHSSPTARVHHLASRSRGRELLSSCNAIPLTTVRQQQPHAAVGHEERWLCHLAEAGCFHACAALGPEQKNQSHVLRAACCQPAKFPTVRAFPSSQPPPRRDPRAKTQLAEMATAEQLDAMSPVDRSQLVRCMQAPLPASAAASLHCSTQLASTQRAPLTRAARSVLHSACDATISPTVLTHK